MAPVGHRPRSARRAALSLTWPGTLVWVTLARLAVPLLLLVTPPFLGRVSAGDRVVRVRSRR